MLSRFLNKNVILLVSTKSDSLLEYQGYLYEDNEHSVILKDVSIGLAMMNLQRNMFGGSASTYAQNLEIVSINKEYIISCYLK